MLKHGVFTLIFLTAVFISGQAFCQQNSKDQQLQSIVGTVLSVDAGGGVLVVHTDKGDVELNISVESNLFRETEPMASIEILKGDHVTVQYDNSSGKNVIVTLTDRKPDEYTSGYTFQQRSIETYEV